MEESSPSVTEPARPTLGVFVKRPRARFFVAAFLPWITASLLAIAIWPLIPEKAIYPDDHVPSRREMALGSWQQPPVHLSLADRQKWFYQGLVLLPIALAPPSLVLGTVAKLLLRLLAPRTALLWRGWLLAGISVCLGMIIGIPVMAFYELEAYSTNEHHLAFCAQWDSNDGEWLDDPNAGSPIGTGR